MPPLFIMACITLAFCAGSALTLIFFSCWMRLREFRFQANEDVWLTTTRLTRLIQDQYWYEPEDYYLRLVKAQDKREQAQDWANFLNRYIP